MVKPYNYTIEDELIRLENEPFNEKIKGEIRKFVNDLKIKENISEIRRINYIQRLRKVAEWIPDSFLDPGEKDIETVLEHLSSDDYTDWTRDTYVTMLKKFYRWKLKHLPDHIANLKIKVKENGKAPDDLITKEEIKALVNNSKNARDRALFSVLYDSGCRIGEIINTRIKDLGFDEFGALLKVTGKTGFRQVRIVGDSIAYLNDYLKSKDDNDYYLFTGLKKNNLHEPMKYYDARKLLLNLKERTGIDKRIYPHLFRHTRASILASKVPESPLENQMGWVHGSKMTSVYVHLSMRDQDNAILKAYGININEKNEIEEKPKKCPRCDYLNPSNAKYCHNCWLPFDEKLALEYENKEREIENKIEKSEAIPGIAKKMIENAPESFKSKLIENVLEEILKDPGLLEKFRKELNQ